MSDLVGFDNFIRCCDTTARNLQGDQLSKAVKKGAKIVQRAIVSAAPEDTGALRSGLILINEKSRTRGKAVYQVVPTARMNAVFQKPITNPVRSKSGHAYYPASQEYGYFTRRPGGGMTYVRNDGSAATMNKVPGKYYMRTGAETAGDLAKETIAQSILDAVAKDFGG